MNNKTNDDFNKSFNGLVYKRKEFKKNRDLLWKQNLEMSLRKKNIVPERKAVSTKLPSALKFLIILIIIIALIYTSIY